MSLGLKDQDSKEAQARLCQHADQGSKEGQARRCQHQDHIEVFQGLYRHQRRKVY